MKHIALMDLETTGLNPFVHEIIEIACIVLNPVTLEIEYEFDAKIIPVHIDIAEPKALEVNGYDAWTWLNEGMSLTEALEELHPKLKDTYMMSYNVSFDAGFLQAAFSRTGIQDPMDHHRLDLATLAWNTLPPEHSLSLRAVAESLGILPEPSVHRAMNGVRCAYEVFKKLRV